MLDNGNLANFADYFASIYDPYQCVLNNYPMFHAKEKSSDVIATNGRELKVRLSIKRINCHFHTTFVGRITQYLIV